MHGSIDTWSFPAGLTLGLLTLAGLLWNDAELRAQAVKSLAAADQELDNKKTEADRLRVIAQREKDNAKIESDKAIEASKRARRVLYAADMHFAHAAWEAEDIPRPLGGRELGRYRGTEPFKLSPLM